jgi:tetratricopeptide (TPR) repeat protein
MVSLFDPSLRSPVDLEVVQAWVGDEGQGDADAWAQLGLGLLQQGQFEAASAAFDRSLSLNPEQRLAHLVQGVLRFQSADFGPALDSFVAVVDGDRDSFTARLYMGLALRATGRLGEALVQFQRAAELYPRDAEAHVEMAEIYDMTDRRTAGLEQWTVVAELDENDVRAPLRVARAARVAGDGDRAVTYARRALQIAPFEAAVHTEMGHACVLVQDWPCVVVELETELRMGAEDRRATLLALTLAYTGLGDDESATRTRSLLGG